MTLFEKVKANLILEHERDDELLQMYINTAIAYAESYQHLPEGHYSENEMPPTTEQASSCYHLTSMKVEMAVLAAFLLITSRQASRFGTL